ncbi:retrovirus-related pol polyprotein from transposon RE2 [Citrus sinensis]|nr:retrovirus-related pol polyprotein from transposon RE2 [Citrus sinensis]
MTQKGTELGQWLPYRKLSLKLQQPIQYLLYQLQETIGFDIESLINRLPKDLGREIKYELCLELLKKMGKFGKWKRALLEDLCDFVQPVTYMGHAYIVHEGDPIDKALLVVQGKLRIYNSGNVTKASPGTNNYLKDGDICGEELVAWVQDACTTIDHFSSDLPTSTGTIQALTKVEAFVLTADDLLLFEQKRVAPFIKAARFLKLFQDIVKRIFSFSGSHGQIDTQVDDMACQLEPGGYIVSCTLLASIRGNRLEKFIDNAVTPPPSHIAQRVDDKLRSVKNPEFTTWRSQDQVMLGWLLSSMSEGIISLVFNLETSLEVWKTIKVQFGSQSKSRLLHLRYMMNSTRKDMMNSTKKDDMKITDYFIKMKNIADNMAAAGSALSSDNLILHVLSSLGPDYNSVATYITGQVGVGKMNVNEAYAMLLTQEARIEQQSQMLAGGRGFGGYGYNSGFGNGGYYKGNFGTESTSGGTGFNSQFKGYQSGTSKLVIGNGVGLFITHTGSAVLRMKSSINHVDLKLNNILLVPKITKNLICISKLTRDNDVVVEFTNDFCFVKDKVRNLIMLQGKAEKGLYRLLFVSSNKTSPYLSNQGLFAHVQSDVSTQPISMFSVVDSKCQNKIASQLQTEAQCSQNSDCMLSTMVLHQRLGHPNARVLNHVINSCPSFKTIDGNKGFDSCDAYLWGPALTLSIQGYKYYISFVDDYTRFTWIFPLKTKVEAFPVFKVFKAQVEKQLDKPIKCLQSDWGGYSPLHKGYKCLHPSGRIYIASHVFFYETSFPYSTDSTFLQSMPSKSSDFLYNSLQVYHISVPNSNQNPLAAAPADTDSHASSSTHNIISLPIPTSQVISTSLISPNNTISSPIVHTTSPAATINIIPNTTTSPAILQNSPSRSLPSATTINTHSMITRAKAGIFKPKAFLTDHNSLEPSNAGEVLSDTKWKAAMQDEYNALIRNKTWSLVPMNPEYKLVGCKWVFRTKYNTDGSVSKYKARLVAKGFHQTAGIDYSETFSPVVKSSTVRPEGFVSEGGYICKLNKALYDLKQAPRAWHDVKGIILVLIYVDDILITGPDSDLLESFIAKLSKVFALKDLGLVTYFLGVEVSYTDHGMHFPQTKYIKDLLSKASMQDYKGTDTPFSTGYKLERSTKGLLGAEFENPTLYRSIEGTLETIGLTGYSDADWACDIDAKKSIGAYCIFLGNNLVSWSSKKQAIVAKSSTESEYRALSAASSKLSWLQSLFSELNITKLPTSVLWCDNQSAGDLPRNLVFHSKSKHIELDIHYIRDKVLNKELEVRYIPTKEQVADVLTKPLSFPKFSYFRSKLNVFNRPLSLRGDVKEAHMSRVVSGAEDCNTCSLLLQVDDMACQLEPGGYIVSCTHED